MAEGGQESERRGVQADNTSSEVAELELFSELTTSESRAQLLLALLERPRGKSELATACGVVDSTAYRHLQTFEEYDWVEYPSSGLYRLTPVGERIAKELDGFVTGLNQVAEKEEFIRHYRGDFEIPTEVLEAGTVSSATGCNAQRAVQNYMEAAQSAVAEGAEIRMFGGTTGPIMISVIKQLADVASRLEVIADAATITGSTSGFGERAQAGELPDHFELLAHPGDIKFGLILFGETEMRLGAYDDRGDIQAGFHSSDPIALEWGDRVYTSVREEAGPVGEVIDEF